MVRLKRFSLPLVHPLVTARGVIEEREGILICLDGGPGGIGEATPLPGWTESVDAAWDGLKDVDADLSVDELQTRLPSVSELPATRHGLSLAILDYTAREENQPVYRSLGGDKSIEHVPVNAVVGDSDTDETVQRVETAVARGFDCVKIKVGVRSVAVDIDRLTAVRDAFPTIELRVDANGAWSFTEAREMIGELAGLDVAIAEQPLAVDDLSGHARLRGNGVGIALDETLVSVPTRSVFAAEAADFVVLKPMVLGGIDRARDIGIQARATGVEPIITTTLDGVVARTAAVHLAASLAPVRAAGLATADRLASDLGPDPAPVTNGTITVPQDVGIGVVTDEVFNETNDR